MSIKVENLSYIYMKDTVFEHKALDDVSFEIKDGEFVGLIGHTGSGKSTLIQHMNGLMKPTSGKVFIDEDDINSKTTVKKTIRERVGLVFQYPEHQLFEETVFRDVAYGPKNLGLDDNEIENRVRFALDMVKLDYNEIKDISPFDLSGGQKRRVAIAGVLAMKPKILILDEPTAGLDPRGRDEILGEIKELHEAHQITVILVSHSMEDIAKLVDKIIVMNKGKIAFIDKPSVIFKESLMLESIGLGVPQATKLARELNKNGFNIGECLSVEDAKLQILRFLRSKKND